MKFYTKQHRYYCGIDLHARTMYACVLNSKGKIVAQKNLKCRPKTFLEFIKPFKRSVVVGVECIFTWYWLADLCSEKKIPFVLGHALYMKAIHGGKAKNDRIDAHKIATLLRGGSMPMAFVYPPEMRATRDLLRRRLHLVRHRGRFLAHVQNTNHQYNLPDIKVKLTVKANREGFEERFTEPSARKSIAVDLAMISLYEEQIKKLEWFILQQAKEKESDMLHRLRTIPGIGPVLALTILYEVQDIDRFPRVQDFASYSRLVKCAKESAGKTYGTGGRKIGNVHLKWAFSEAAVLYLRGNPEGQKYLNRLARKHGKGKALSILAHKIGRAVYFMMKRRKSFNKKIFLAA